MPQKARDVESSLISKGFQKVNKRDHNYYFFYHEGKKTAVFTKISHGESEIHDQNCSKMARQIKLTNPQFKDFVNCPLRANDYLKILTDGRYI